ncbi:MAG: endonuclease/exonuclease/phosphatase family protein [Deltaproteobacteria bacterium]|nr:endonuclease/exonuclease/phosphatase family protein [Deltaproteobacteria bacterium]
MTINDEAPPNFAPPPPAKPGAARRRAPRSRLWAAAWVTAFTAVVVGGAHYLAVAPIYPLVVMNMMLPWLAAAAIAAFTASVLGRQGMLIPFALLGALASSWPVAGERLPQNATYPQGLPFRVLTANLYVGNTNHQGTIASLLGADADVICLEEVTHGWAVSLEAIDVTTAYPHRLLSPEDSPFGIALLSRLPLTDVEEYSLADLPQLRATVDVEGTAVEVHCVHLMPPFTPDLYAVHRRGGDELLAMLTARPPDAGPIVVAGDFNSTPYNALHNQLTAMLEDAWIAGEDGFGHSAPANLSAIPPMRVDHVYVGAGARSMGGELLPGNGSDHYPVAVDLAIPRQMASP